VRIGHRAFEAAAVAASTALIVVPAWRLLAENGAGLWPVFVAAFLLGHPVADFASGLVHWSADRALSESAPYFGRHFVRPFREHHAEPCAITRHDFIETNGNTCIALVPFLAASWWFLARTPALQAFALSLAFWLFWTNPIHRWAHAADPPACVRWLQRQRLILAPAHHAVHHVDPFDRRFCITSGWCNPVLDRFEIFANMERWLRGGDGSVSS
jgi:ubiquitin-conjugating enzyme E2 variant